MSHSLVVLTQPDGVLKLGGFLELAGAGELRKALEAAIGSHVTLTVDLSEAESCDAAAFQLLCSARRSALARGGGFRIAAISDAATDAAASIGLKLEDLNDAATWAAREEGNRDAAVI